jgi:hypothetical protein
MAQLSPEHQRPQIPQDVDTDQRRQHDDGVLHSLWEGPVPIPPCQHGQHCQDDRRAEKEAQQGFRKDGFPPIQGMHEGAAQRSPLEEGKH